MRAPTKDGRKPRVGRGGGAAGKARKAGTAGKAAKAGTAGTAGRTAKAGAASRVRRAGRAAKAGKADHGRQPLEQRILLTATMCLMAFGAVMVYSASSATTLLQGHGNGSSYLIRFVIYGGIGLVVMRLLARDGVAKVHLITAPLLAVSFALVVAVHIPHIGVSINGARRWIGPPQMQFQPSELMKIALVLYCATLLAKRPSRVHDLKDLAKPLLIVVGCAVLLVFTQPDLGTALVMAFTVATMLVAAGIPLQKLGKISCCVLGVVFLYALAKPYARARL
ncbi:MAG TPA: FtsW/RodA/SpoVE family cell cycle protein, partial [Phenylobacterium sp.]|nr:FtsW/RodA/SpoVE family cell cycle protein [Phenylobacterium sp.]